MKPGLAAVLAVALALPGGLGFQLGCSHPTPREPIDPVVDPDEHPPLPVHAIVPHGRLSVPKVRAFMDFAVPRLRSTFARLAKDREPAKAGSA